MDSIKDKKWTTGDLDDSMTCLEVDGEDFATLYADDAKALAHQICDEHNRLAVIEARLGALVEAVNKVDRLLWGFTAAEGNGLLDLAVALEQARAALVEVGTEEA